MTQSGFHLFISTFALIFVSELPDKTAFAAVLMSARGHPLAVYLGTCAAFFVQSIVAVAFGGLFSLLPVQVVRMASGVLFLVFAYLSWTRKEESPGNAAQSGAFWKTAGAAFTVIFLAEWGDLTQLATATLVAKTRAPLVIFCAATLALWSATGISVWAGAFVGDRLRPDLLKKGAAVAFVGVGLYLLLSKG